VKPVFGFEIVLLSCS